jgi:hypothetical protein
MSPLRLRKAGGTQRRERRHVGIRSVRRPAIIASHQQGVARHCGRRRRGRRDRGHTSVAGRRRPKQRCQPRPQASCRPQRLRQRLGNAGEDRDGVEQPGRPAGRHGRLQPHGREAAQPMALQGERGIEVGRYGRCWRSQRLDPGEPARAVVPHDRECERRTLLREERDHVPLGSPALFPERDRCTLTPRIRNVRRFEAGLTGRARTAMERPRNAAAYIAWPTNGARPPPVAMV